MRNYYYYGAFRKTTVQFLDLFNDINIKRYDRGGNFVKYVEVPVKYSPKEKIWFWLNERKDDEMLPVLSVALTGVEYSLERAANKHQKINACSVPGVLRQFLNPVPYDLTFSVSLWALYMADVDQILEQILPFFQPYVMIRVYSPELESKFDVKTIFNSATPDIDFEYTDETFRILKYTLDFTVQTYLFKPMENVGIVQQILVNYYTNDAAWAKAREDARSGSVFTSAASGESQLFTMVPPYLTADTDPIYDYELFSMGDKVGSRHVSGGIEHINHDVRIQESSGDLQTWNISAGIPSAAEWIPHP